MWQTRHPPPESTSHSLYSFRGLFTNLCLYFIPPFINGEVLEPLQKQTHGLTVVGSGGSNAFQLRVIIFMSSLCYHLTKLLQLLEQCRKNNSHWNSDEPFGIYNTALDSPCPSQAFNTLTSLQLKTHKQKWNYPTAQMPPAKMHWKNKCILIPHRF